MVRTNNVPALKNVSLSGEPVALQPQNIYILFDPLYVNNIAKVIKKKLVCLSNSEIIHHSLPYTLWPYVKVIPKKETFPVSNIVLAKTTDLEEDPKKCVSSDTGLLIMMHDNYFKEICEHFSYDDLVEVPIDSPEIINWNYWNKIIEQFPERSMALIDTRGILKHKYGGGGIFKL